MSEQYEQQQGNEELWKTIFGVGHPDLLKQQWLHQKLPQKPRCRLCLAPFKGIGGWFMRRKGKAPNSRNPNYCNACDSFLETFPGGAEVDMSVLYVDIRQSTEYSQSHKTADVSQRINHFLSEATRIITDNDGFIMAFYGDCVVAAWPPGFSGNDHAQKVFKTAQQLVKDKNMVDSAGDPIPIGVGIHTGPVYIGTVTALQGSFRDISIFGNSVNLAARLASQASAMQALSTQENIVATGQKPDSYENDSVELKGFSEPVKAYTIS